ncbi:MAG: hypothetical protein M1480_11705 [Bacteroidetes bacterium]|nr:hypothetical protein [Bacteroidota bacterium]
MNIFKYIYLCLFVSLISLNLFSQTKTDGWEEGSKYNKLFKITKIDTVTGYILQVENIPPMQGMTEGIILKVKSGKDTLIVHVCPKWMGDLLNIKLQPEDEVIIEGGNTKCNGNTVFMATKLTANGIILQLRDEKGTPIWDRLR